jgi:uncharacterized membrane protein YccC
MPHRRAYFPRPWPLIATAAMVAFGLSLLLHDLPLWLQIPIGGLVGCAISYGRIAVWRRRHPEITVEDAIADRRRSARWN